MLVKDLIKKLQEFDENYEVEIQVYSWWDMKTFPSLNERDPEIYEDEEWYETHRVIIDLWDE